jgi:hypothetical protein
MLQKVPEIPIRCSQEKQDVISKIFQFSSQRNMKIFWEFGANGVQKMIRINRNKLSF